MSDTPLLKVDGLKVAYGHIEAVKGIDFELHEGQITTLVGANGAGKSTTLLALSGLVKKAAGRVVLDGQDLTTLAPHKIVASRHGAGGRRPRHAHHADGPREPRTRAPTPGATAGRSAPTTSTTSTRSSPG